LKNKIESYLFIERTKPISSTVLLFLLELAKERKKFEHEKSVRKPKIIKRERLK
jgi:hypothetical protein